MKRSNPRYFPQIDGLRGIAVLAVILFHSGASMFSAGYVGVDIFFVVSGFLITHTIIRDIESHRFTVSKFYVRRFRRIAPAAGVMILSTSILATYILLPLQLLEYSREALASMWMVANLFFWQTTGYFDQAADSRVLLHMWSLSVEEQFYLLYPLLLRWLVNVGRSTARVTIVSLAGC